MSTNEEQWLPVAGVPGYEVSDHGRVRSVDRTIERRGQAPMQARGRILRSSDDGRGYRHVSLPGGRKVRVGVLVLEAFVGPRPAGLDCCHDDDVKTNNVLANLRWDSRSANLHDRVRNGGHPLANRDRCGKDHMLAGANLTFGKQRRRCVACKRAHDYVRISRKRGVILDFGSVADAYYREICGVAA